MIKFEKLPDDIISRIPGVQEVLSRDNRVLFAYLFGGLAAGRVHPLSDLDMAVYLTDTVELALYKLALFDNLTEALGTAEIDLVVLNTASISIAGRVLQNRRLLIDKAPFRRHAWESLILRQFFDFRVKENELFARRYGIAR
jgi:uncharacterized protein